MHTPTSVDEIGTEWLSSILGVRVSSMSVQRIGAGEGFMGQLARVTPDTGPSVIVKMPTADPGGLMIGQMMRVWEREHRFYTEIAPRLEGIRVPRCLHSQAEPWILV
ncbi:MAG: hypothetical protein EBT79_14665, partial [Actinobacteria bacterium]|nr:hypothetical protein [Actinomycetota bacterium]